MFDWGRRVPCAYIHRSLFAGCWIPSSDIIDPHRSIIYHPPAFLSNVLYTFLCVEIIWFMEEVEYTIMYIAVNYEVYGLYAQRHANVKKRKSSNFGWLFFLFVFCFFVLVYVVAKWWNNHLMTRHAWSTKTLLSS